MATQLQLGRSNDVILQMFNDIYIVKICLSISVQFVRSDKTVCLNQFKQIKKHPKPLTDAKHKAWCFSTSEIKISCNTESQT